MMRRGEGNVSESSEGTDEDEEVDKLSHISNIKKGGYGSGSSLRRYDEYQSFLTRSERAIAKPDLPPSEDEKKRRKVQFPDSESRLVTIRELDPITSAESDKYYMHKDDFLRCDRDVEMTSFRWENHLSGRIPFDEENNTLRGLEEMFEDTNRSDIRSSHLRNVLEEMNRQRRSGKKQLDWHRIREASMRMSSEATRRAVEVAQKDEEEKQRILTGTPIAKPNYTYDSGSNKKSSMKKKKGGPLGGLMFWKKK